MSVILNQTLVKTINICFVQSLLLALSNSSSKIPSMQILKTGSDEILYWVGRCSFLLGQKDVINTKNSMGAWKVYLAIFSSNQKLSFQNTKTIVWMCKNVHFCTLLTLFLPDLVTWRSYKGWFRPWPVGIGLSRVFEPLS